MKRNSIFFLPFVLIFVSMLLSSCFKGSTADTTPLAQINGTFSGTFYKLRLKSGTTSTYDTAGKAAISLTLSTSTGFAVTGDTTTLHAGSKGDYQYNSLYFQFADNTYAPNTTQTKIHLYGTYSYGYSATTNQLQLEYNFPQDTLIYFYNLKK